MGEMLLLLQMCFVLNFSAYGSQPEIHYTAGFFMSYLIAACLFLYTLSVIIYMVVKIVESIRKKIRINQKKKKRQMILA